MFTPRSFGKAGVEAYAAYALRAWLSSEDAVSPRTRRFAKWSAICSFLLGMAGQVALHLLADAVAARAPWAITTIVSCLPVLVLGMGTALAHMLRADAAAADRSGTTDDATDHGTGGPAGPRSARWSPADRTANAQESVLPEDRTARSPRRDRGDAAGPDTAPAARAGRNACPEPRRDAPDRPETCRCRDARVTADPAQQRSHGLQRPAGRTGTHGQCGTSDCSSR